MDNDKIAELYKLKKNYLEAEQVNYNEKVCLLNVINNFGLVVAMHEEYIEEFRSLKKMVNNNKALPLNLIEKEVGKLRNKIYNQERKEGFDRDTQVQQNELDKQTLEECRILKGIVDVLLYDFYPITDELKVKGDFIQTNCHVGIEQIELEETNNAFLSFIKELKDKISKDFRYINDTFSILLDHVKELEKTLMSEFGGDIRLKEIEQFEIKVKNEVGSIVNSFNISATIDEIKNIVIEKLTKIKRLVSIRKNEEIRKTKKTQENINKLKKKIVETERSAHEISKKAKHFQIAATKDGLTGLYNRKAFDMRINDSLKALSEGGEQFSVVLFDIDRFKWINDTFGHVGGDKVLTKVAQCLKKTFRKNDFVARYGGDEFVVIIAGLSEEMARERIFKFKINLREQRFLSHETGDLNVTVSPGIALAIAGESPNDLIHRADMNMYTYKKKKCEHL